MNEQGYSCVPTLSALNAELSPQADLRRTWQQCPACLSAKIGGFACIRKISYERCRDCGFTFANPSPADDVISRFYNSDFYNNYRKLEEDRIKQQPYYSISAYTDLEKLAGWIPCDKTAAILDFGCGPGSFLALLRDRFGFSNVEGLELNEESAGIAWRNYGLKIANDKSQLNRRHYDVVILFEVIEHAPDPGEIIRLCDDLLKPGGVLFVTTPSVRNIPSRRFPSHAPHFTGPSHVSLFTETALRELLDRFSLEIIRLETDACNSVLGSYAAAPFYDLDFVSPQSIEDNNDALFVPTRLGRALGLAANRGNGAIIAASRRADRLLMRVAAAFGASYSDHLYVIARKATI